MKLIGVISDTHIPEKADSIPPKVFEVFKEVDMIIHAGDLVQLTAISDLETLAPVIAVFGNMDPLEVRLRLPETTSVKVYNWNIGVTHDVGVGLWGMKSMREIAKGNKFNVLIFGHTHRPFLKQEEGIWYVNPGSPTFPLPPFIVKPSVALLKVEKEKIEPRIVRL